ncbi:MAG: T9SS type A sorting domain-containing protein, partial [Sphingobacteriales bacterium]
FTPIGRILANENGGNGAIYSFTDYTFFAPGNTYYRLKQVDADGKYVHSSIVLIKLAADKQPLVAVYPNPIQSSVAITLGKEQRTAWQVQLFSTLGQIMYNKQLPPAQSQAILSMENVPAGMYQLKISDRDGTLLYAGSVIKQ